MVIALILLCLAAIFPPERNLKLGKDLAGGVTLTYSLDVQPDDPPDTVDKTISVLKDRLDPNGMKELSMVQQGRDRIQISFPLPNDEVKALRADFEEKLDALREYEVDPSAFERAMRSSGEERIARLEEMIGGSAAREQILRPVIAAAEAADSAREAYESYAAEAADDDPRASELLDAAVDAEESLEAARQSVTIALVSADDVRAALQLSNNPPRVLDSQTGEPADVPSARERALASIRERLVALDAEMGVESGGAEAALDAILASHEAYAEKRTGFDDPNEVIRLLQGAGVLSFRIAVVPGTRADEQMLRNELRERGPDAISVDGIGWFPLRKLEHWYSNTDDFEAATTNTAAYFQGYRLVVEERNGVYYALMHDRPGMRLTRSEGEWGVRSASPTLSDDGLPAVQYRMDPRGAALMSRLTEPNVGQPMAILLDDFVYTAPTIQSRLAENIRVTGNFQQREVNDMVKMLNAGSLQARLGERPISQNTLAPTLGKDNLMKGLEASWIALVAVCVFMVFYYFTNGVVAVIALATNAILILGAMSLARAAFTLPGIAGIVLTFGMAVDANVLIYERIREELIKGNELKAAVRISYQKVLSTIVDANITNLIVCFVLAYTATPEVKGFAITLGIGIVATLFSALFVTRLLYAILLDFVKIKKMGQLPITLPVIDKILTPKWDFIALRPVLLLVSAALVGTGVFMIVHQGEKMLGTEFRGGTEVAIELREGAGTMERSEVEGRVQAIVADAEAALAADPDDAEAVVLARLTDATVVPVNPEADGVSSDVFKIATTISEDEATEISEQQILGEAIVSRFADVIDQRQPLRFARWDSEEIDAAPVDKIIREDLGSNIGRPEVRIPVDRYVGGVYVLMDDFQAPLPSKQELSERLEYMRTQPDYSGTLKRPHELIVLDGTDSAVESAVLVSIDPSVSFYNDESRWERVVAQREWDLVRDALTGATTLAGVQSFSASIAQDFKAQAIVAVALSFLLILAYIWIRFGSVRYSFAAIAALLHDVVAVLGLIALAEILYENFPGLAAIGIQPFKIDLGLVAAILTIIGYSLNDTIVILDRIRENRGKLAYASRECVNTSISQTLSRTLITSGTTLVALVVMFVIGGEGIASFTYALLCGVVVGTYSSVAVASPLVFSSKIPPASKRYSASEPAESERELVGTTG